MLETNYVYLLECGDGTLYAGWTTDPQTRLAAHNAGRGAKYTRGRLPVKMVYLETFATKSDAMKREVELKKLTRAQKLALVARIKPCSAVKNEDSGGKEVLMMNAKIDRAGCISCGLCAETCPAVFRMADDGLAEVCASPVPETALPAAKEASDGCPVSVITVE